jgi:hypothetical protein
MNSLAGVTEWRPASFDHITPLEISLLAVLFLALSRGLRLPVMRLLVLLGLLHMSLQHSRHEMLLAVVGTLLLARPLAVALGGEALGGEAIGADDPDHPARWPLAVASLLALALVGVRLAAPLVRTDGVTSPISALEHVPSALAAQPVFNDYGFGGYLIFKGVRPFIDARTDMYGDTFVNHYFRAERPDLRVLDDTLVRWKISWTLLQPSDPVVDVLDHRPGWRRLYSDRYAVIHVRDGTSSPVPR